LCSARPTTTFQEIIEASTTYGWQTFDQALIEAFRRQQITEERHGFLPQAKARSATTGRREENDAPEEAPRLGLALIA